jgi:hypothetical protein
MNPRDVVFGGELGIAGLFTMNALGSAITAAMAQPGLEQMLSVALAVWTGALAWFLLMGGPRWHAAALVTVSLACLGSLMAMASGIPVAVFPALVYGIASIYLAFTLNRKRSLMGSNNALERTRNG